MRVGLFIPCYVDALYPQVGVATYRLLRKLKIDVVYPERQTCCGQPMATEASSVCQGIWPNVSRMSLKNLIMSSLQVFRVLLSYA